MQMNTHGVRRLAPGVLAARARLAEETVGEVSRKDLAVAAREASQALLLRPSVRLVLGELAGCYGAQKLARGLMVWPSNDYIMRKTGLGERTVRKCVRELAQIGLIVCVDSANRKRFAIKSRSGEILDAFGFDLTPLYGRRLEFAGLLIQQREAKKRLNRLYDEITIARKASEEALRAIEEHFPTFARADFERRFEELAVASPRRGAITNLDPIVASWRTLREDVENAFYLQFSEHEKYADAGTRRRHFETNNGLSTDSCKESFENAPPEIISLSLITEACPAVAEFAECVVTEADVIRVGRDLRGTIGAHRDAWDEALTKVGPLRAAVLVMIVLQFIEDDVASGVHRIKNPGGLYRDLVRRCGEGKLNLLTELRSLRRRHAG